MLHAAVSTTTGGRSRLPPHACDCLDLDSYRDCARAAAARTNVYDMCYVTYACPHTWHPWIELFRSAVDPYVLFPGSSRAVEVLSYDLEIYQREAARHGVRDTPLYRTI